MKNFTLMLLAAFVAVASFAVTPVQQSLPMAARQKMPATRLHQPNRKAVKAPLPLAKRNVSPLAKAPKKASRAMTNIDAVVGEFMLASAYYDYDEDQGFVYAEPSMGATPVTITKVDDTTLSIEGFTSSATEPIIAKVDLENGIISIDENQLLFTDEEYGPVFLKNAQVEGPITGTISEEEGITLGSLWYTEIGGDGEYAGEMWDYFYFYSMTAPINGTMTWVNDDAEEETAKLWILPSSTEPFIYTIFNFGNFETAIDVTLKYGNKFLIEDQLIEDAGTYGQFLSCGLTDDGEDVIPLTGTGTETTLTFDCKWTSYAASTGYWYGLQEPAVITVLDDIKFLYPDTPETEAVEVTIDFNAMDVATSNNQSSSGDITETYVVSNADVTLIISPKDESSQIPNRFWRTSSGPQLRVYSGTLTFEVPEGFVMTKIDFDAGKWNEGNSADTGEIDGTTWEGEAQSVTFSIAGNTQLNSVTISVVSEGGEGGELVTLPDGVEPEVWTIDGSFISEGVTDVQMATEVAFNGNDIYIKGLSYYFEDSWLKGTLVDGVATFPSGQYVGEDDYGTEYMLGADEEDNIIDIQFAYDADAKTLTQLTPYIVENGDSPTEWHSYGYWTGVIYYEGEPVIPEPVVAPEGLVTESYLFQGKTVQESDDEEEEGEEEIVDYEAQVQVGFDGNDLYIQGIAEDFPTGWVKATKNEDGKYVIPANQYMGSDVVMNLFTLNYYFTAVIDDEEMVDAVLTFDPEAKTITSNQTLVVNGSKNALSYYQVFTDVVMTKINAVAAVPADPSVVVFSASGDYPYVEFNIPTQGTNGETLLITNLAYQIFIEKNGEVQPLTLSAALYDMLDEDMTMIPYTYDDDWDIYAGGSSVYLNQGTDELQSWTKIGVKSYYSFNDVIYESNLVWYELQEYWTGVNRIATNGQQATFFDLQGRKANASQKGVLIMQVRQQDGTMKTTKVVRK